MDHFVTCCKQVHNMVSKIYEELHENKVLIFIKCDACFSPYSSATCGGRGLKRN